jgi:hypothetical protein
MPSDSRKPQAVVLVIGLIGAAVGFGTALGIVAFAWLLGRPRR